MTYVRRVEVVVVVGSKNSSNTNRLRELAAELGCDTYQVDSASELKPEWFVGKRHIGVTSGASAPEVLVKDVIEAIRGLGAKRVKELDGITETITFPLPRGLKSATDPASA